MLENYVINIMNVIICENKPVLCKEGRTCVEQFQFIYTTALWVKNRKATYFDNVS